MVSIAYKQQVFYKLLETNPFLSLIHCMFCVCLRFSSQNRASLLRHNSQSFVLFSHNLLNCCKDNGKLKAIIYSVFGTTLELRVRSDGSSIIKCQTQCLRNTNTFKSCDKKRHFLPLAANCCLIVCQKYFCWCFAFRQTLHQFCINFICVF